MNLKEIRELINLMNENDLSEIELEREGNKVKIKKAGSEYMEPLVTRHPPEYKAEKQPAGASDDTKSAVAPSNTKIIASPMVGTFYRAPSPDAPPFIDVSQIVEIGQVVCVVEAMKLMNEVKSEVRGKVVEIPIENAQPVEFGQTLFVIEPV